MNPLAKRKIAGLLQAVAKNNQARDSGNPLPPEQEIRLFYEIAKFYDGRIGDNDLPFAKELALEAYRAAALLEDNEAQFICGERFLNIARFWQEQLHDVFSIPIYRTYAESNYREAFHFLTQAQKGKHAGALRLHGMAYVNGWGLEQNLQKGYQMVIDSIDWANAWNEATKIFEKLGLNSPEFFSALGARGKNR